MVGPGLASLVGFLIFLGVAYLIYRTATRSPEPVVSP
jgi:hypothetical protein